MYALSHICKAAIILLTLDEKNPRRFFDSEALLRRMNKHSLLDESQNVEGRMGELKSKGVVRVNPPSDQKRINDALDKHLHSLDKSSPSISKGTNGRLSVPSTSSGWRDSRSAAQRRGDGSTEEYLF
ncbi:hypothetical protein SUGI_0566220 [Cryptomeria japonica]|nr:hypothetical protein SUGI_0566220 [Cryptomeria japonica]